jgi:hypothetical protein
MAAPTFRPPELDLYLPIHFDAVDNNKSQKSIFTTGMMVCLLSALEH